MSVHPFHPAGPTPVTISWQVRLDAARTEAEVVDVVRDFMATISPYDIARLPERSRPRKIVDDEPNGRFEERRVPDALLLDHHFYP